MDSLRKRRASAEFELILPRHWRVLANDPVVARTVFAGGDPYPASPGELAAARERLTTAVGALPPVLGPWLPVLFASWAHPGGLSAEVAVAVSRRTAGLDGLEASLGPVLAPLEVYAVHRTEVGGELGLFPAARWEVSGSAGAVRVWVYAVPIPALESTVVVWCQSPDGPGWEECAALFDAVVNTLCVTAQ